jgi:AcrR family transcriptional regulator
MSSAIGMQMPLEQRKERTRELLMAAALSLFARKGFEATTIAEIAAAVGVSPRTVYRYFPTKQDLILGDVPASLERLLVVLRSRPAGEDALTAVAASLLEYASSLDREEVARRVLLIAANPALDSRALEFGEEAAAAMANVLARRAGLSEPDLGLRLAADLGQRVLVLCLRAWAERGAPAGKFRGVVEEALQAARLLDLQPRRKLVGGPSKLQEKVANWQQLTYPCTVGDYWHIAASRIRESDGRSVSAGTGASLRDGAT